jgi:hypothetical protein
MPIRVYLSNGHKFDAETVRALGVAFEIARAALDVDDHNEPARQVIATKLIELATLGERDPDRLAEQLLAIIDLKTLPPKTFQQQIPPKT